MNPSDGRTFRGFLADGDTGAGLAGLRVELWGANGHGYALLAATRRDDAGVFRMRVPSAEPGSHAPPDVEWRVLDRGTLLLTDVRPLPPPGRDEPIDLTVPVPVTEGEDQEAAPARYEIVGRV